MTELANELKEMIIEVLGLEDITAEDIVDDAPLFGEGLGLDSIDALELALALKKRYNIQLTVDSTESKKYFKSINSLVQLVDLSNNR